MRTKKPSGKLDDVYLGPYKVIEKVGDHAYKLDLLLTMKLHPVFSTSSLKPCHNNPITSQPRPENPPPEVIDDYKEYHVDHILDLRYSRRRIEYLVLWTGYDEPTWEPWYNFKNAKAKVEEFHS